MQCRFIFTFVVSCLTLSIAAAPVANSDLNEAFGIPTPVGLTSLAIVSLSLIIIISGAR
ncbi:hypothetical protein K438DRAFT_1858795 [Mycena galopus ATCC 62051]|nr:hypothetical protein K438DRAFT_1858795 [Mycena galopus ATCC 62051]